MEAKHIFMYIWKEAIHGNRHSDQDADSRAWHTKRAFEESGFFAKPTQFAVISFNVRGLSKKFVEFVNKNKTTIPIKFKFVYN